MHTVVVHIQIKTIQQMKESNKKQREDKELQENRSCKRERVKIGMSVHSA